MSASDDDSVVLPAEDDVGPILPTRYATFTSRFRAALIDTFLVAVAVVLIVVLGDAAANVPGSGRVALLLLFGLAFLYEPLFVWRRGATIGHARKNLVVIAEATGRPPGFGRAFARFLVKAVCGLPSFVTMAFSRKHQTIHDWLTRTTVRLAPSADVAEHDYHLDVPDEPDLALPSRPRRAAIVILYLVALFVIYGVVLSIVDPAGCVRAHDCGAGTKFMIDIVALAWLTASVGVVIGGWKGMLVGARRGLHADPGVSIA